MKFMKGGGIMQDKLKEDKALSKRSKKKEPDYTENEAKEPSISSADTAENQNTFLNLDEHEAIAPKNQDPEAEKEEVPLEESQFIIPDSAEFFITEPEILEDGADSYSSSKSELLDIEHFQDYKSVPKAEPQSSEPADEGNFYNSESLSYESLTILDSEPDESAKVTSKREKYVNPDGKEYDAENPRKVDTRFDFLELFVFTLVAVMIITTFIFRHSVVEGPSMQNTLQDGEHLIISGLFYTPKRGDIVVCQDYETGHKNPIVKRVIAVGGDTVEILPDGSVLVNGELQREDYVFIDPGMIDTFPGMEEVTVPEDMVFVMGDHRNMSSDSREFLSTFVREDAILGKVILRFYPFEKFGTVN